MGIFSCQNITLFFLVAAIAISVGVLYHAYQRTQLYYPDQTWSVIDTIPVWSADHPHSVITAGPHVSISTRFSDPTAVDSLQVQLLSDPDLKSYKIHTFTDITNSMTPPTSLLTHIAGIQPWDRRNYFISWWNYALYDKTTQYTFVVMYLFHRYPEWVKRAPETHVSVAAFTPHGMLVTSANFIVHSKDVLFHKDTDLYYNTTTMHRTTTKKTPWSFSHVMDAEKSEVYMTGHFPTKYNCDWTHPDRVAPGTDVYVDLVSKINDHHILSSPQYKSNKKDSETFAKKNVGNHTSTEPIDIDAFIKLHTYDIFLEKQSTAEKSSKLEFYARQNFTCTSMLTFNYTLLPTEQGFANYDISAERNEHTVTYSDFVQSYVKGHEEGDETLLFAFSQRKHQGSPQELLKTCKNGASYLHGYNSVADGFLTLSSLPDEHTAYNFPPNFVPIDATIASQKFIRNYHQEQDCGDLDISQCITASVTPPYYDYMLMKLRDSPDKFDKIILNNLAKLKQYRYAMYYDLTITTMTPNSITFWSHAPQRNIPSLYKYLQATGKLHTLQRSYHNSHKTHDEQMELAEILWGFTHYVNRFRWYGGSSFGCCLTRGSPSYRYPWAWIAGSHTMNKNDSLYIYGVPVPFTPNGQYIVNEAYLRDLMSKNGETVKPEYISQLLTLIKKEAQQLSFNRDYSHLISALIQLPQTPSPAQLLTLPPAVTKEHQNIYKQSANGAPFDLQDLSFVFGDARIDSDSSNGILYGAYSFIKQPSKPQLSTRTVIFKDNTSYHPPHPWTFDENLETIYGEHDNDYYNTFLTTKHFTHKKDLNEQPISTAMTFFDQYNAYYARFNKDYLQRFLHNMHNLPIIRASSDGHLSLFNITNYGYTIYQDQLGSIYTPTHRVFTQETRTQWIMFHAKGLVKGGNSWERDTPGFTMRAVVPMWTDIGVDAVVDAQLKQHKLIDDLRRFHKDIQSEQYSKQYLTLPIQRILLTAQELADMEKNVAFLDGKLTVYTDLRSIITNTTAVIYNKHYIRGACSKWYSSIGKALIAHSDINNSSPIPSTCPQSGDYQYTMWCAEYPDYSLASTIPVDELDFNPDIQDLNSCVVFTKHLYIPQIDVSLTEHAYESSINLETNYLLEHFGEYFASGAKKKQIDLLLSYMEKFYNTIN